MNVRRYFAIVGAVLLVFTAAFCGIMLAQYMNMTQRNMGLDNINLDALTNKETVNILVMGTDAEGLRTDVMILAQLDVKNKRVNMLSIPRDTRVRINGSYQKINSAFALGKEDLSIVTTKDLLDIPIHHYALFNFKAFRDFIDVLGGVDFDVPQRMKYSDPYQHLYIDLQPGMQHLDGDKSEQLIRFRRYLRGDEDRIIVQQNFFHALIEQKLQPKYLAKLPELYAVMTSNLYTDLELSDLFSYARTLLTIPTESYYTYTLPGEGRYIGDVSYFVYYQDELEELMTTIFSGNIPQELSSVPTQEAAQ